MIKTMIIDGSTENLWSLQANECAWGISITNLKIQASVGILKKETEEKQVICINVRCDVLMPPPHDCASSHQVVCYNQLIEKIKDYFKKKHVYLLETAVVAILDICLADRRVQKAWVRVEKTNLYDDVDRVGVEMSQNQKI